MSRGLTQSNVLVLVSRGSLPRHFRSDTTQGPRPAATHQPAAPPRARARTLGPTWQQAAPIQYPARRRRLPVFSSRSSVLGDRLATSSYRCAGTHGFHASRGCPPAKIRSNQKGIPEKERGTPFLAISVQVFPRGVVRACRVG